MREAATDGPAGERRDAEGGGLPEADCRTQAASADPAMEAGTMTASAESPGITRETAASGPESPWSRAGVPEDALVFPVTTPRKIARRGLPGRLRGSNFGKGRKIPESGPGISVPANLRPWTWEVLPHVKETRDGSPLARLMDRIAWHTTHPDARYVLHAERLRRRRESLATRAMARFAALLARRPGGPPPWIAEDDQGQDP